MPVVVQQVCRNAEVFTIDKSELHGRKTDLLDELSTKLSINSRLAHSCATGAALNSSESGSKTLRY
jgi:hypothetical protein